MSIMKLAAAKTLYQRFKTSSFPLGNRKWKQKRLLTAIKNNFKEVVQLLNGGCPLSKNLDCFKSRYPLAVAIGLQNKKIISFFLQHGACVNKPIHSSGSWTLLHRAVVLKNIAIIQIILQHDVDWNATDKNGVSVLYLVYKEKDGVNEEQKIINILNIFLNLGMDINIKTNADRSPLYLAVKNGMKIVIDILMERGADLNVRDNKDDSLAHLQVTDQYRMLWNDYLEKNKKIEEHVTFLDWLLLKGENIDGKNKNGESPLQLALKYKLMESFHALLKYVNNVNVTDDCNRNTLHVLYESGSNLKSISKQILLLERSVERIVKLLLDKGASVDIVVNNGNTPLYIATENKMIKCLLIMINRFTDVNASNNNLETLLHILSKISVNYGDSIGSDISNVVKVLIFRNANVKNINKDNMTAVQLAVLHKNKEMLELLKNYGADLHVRTIYGESLLHLAIKLSDKTPLWKKRKEDKQIVNILEILLDRDLDVNSTMDNGETPLFLAVKNRMRNVIELLIKRGADLNICNRNGDSVAHYLINKNFKLISSMYDHSILSDDKISSKVQEDLDFMDWLLSKGVNVDLKNECGVRPLELAIKLNLLRVIPILLKYANDVNFINEGKLAILHTILQLNKQSKDDDGYESTSGILEPSVMTFDVKKVVETLLDKGISVDIKDNFKNTALHIGAQQTQPELISILLKHTKNINANNDLGWTPLHFACQTGNVEIVKTLIEHGADVNITEDTSSKTPLFIAVYNDHKDLIEVLAEAGADLNAKDDTGQTVLHMVNSLKSSMSTLLRLGADVDAKDDWGHVPLYYAMIRQDAQAIGQLLDYGANVSKKTLSNFVLRELLATDSVMGHHAKLMAAQLSIPKIYTSLTFRNYAAFYKECLKEVEKMRACAIDDCTTLYDFLHMNSKTRHAYEVKKRFQNVVKLSSLTKQFPHYCNIILAKRQEARSKRSLVKSAKYAWWELTDIFLPDICLENILEKLDKVTLKGLCESPQTM